MGTIVVRPRKNNTTLYMAKIVRKSEGKVIYRETATFDRRAAAVSWLARHVHELDQPGALERAQRTEYTLADTTDKYVADAREIGGPKCSRRSRVTTSSIMPVWEHCRMHGVSGASIYKLKVKFGSMDICEAKRLKTPDDENTKLKRLNIDTDF